MAFLHDVGRLATVGARRRPGGLAELERLHALAALAVVFHPGAGVQVDDNAVGVRMQRRRFAVADDLLQHAHAFVLERDAIDVYNKLVQKTHGKDPITYALILHILEEEVEHENEFEMLIR